MAVPLQASLRFIHGISKTSQCLLHTMRRLRKGRAISLVLLLLICPLLYLFRPRTIVIVTSTASDTEHDYPDRYSYPVYEYTSLYRQHANAAFESFLDAKLHALEQSITQLPAWSNLPADLAIHQFTTPELAKRYGDWANQWRDNNGGWAHSIKTEPARDLVSLFITIPQVHEIFDNHAALQADLTRYLTLWYHGGLYADIETWRRVSMTVCHPIVEVHEGRKNVSLMLGIGVDEPFLNTKELKEREWTRGFGFSDAVMWAPRRFDPILRTAIVRTISHARLWDEIGGSTVEVGGTGMLSDIVLEALSEGLIEEHTLRDRDAGLERRVTWKKFKGMKEELWIEPTQLKDGILSSRGVAVLPINVWGNGQDHSGSGTREAGDACVNWIPGALPGK